ncbi:chitobiase/beta-hexosaminidase C-terminal domain-containing protein [Streptomyces sp. NPDC020917]|uniref:chitobiase/beta-hexosaminidase C-terminal domain-containing protein n=1 Tax=Streptomyces sp. NPDC020917 TaxID=3365102 RepID=UPI0037960306
MLAATVLAPVYLATGSQAATPAGTAAVTASSASAGASGTAAQAGTPVAVTSPVTVATYTGEQPALPKQVQVTTADGGTRAADVTWDLSGYSFDKPYRTFTVPGSVEGALATSAQVEVVPHGTLYYVDSGMLATTPAYGAVKQLTGSDLRNGAADQQYTAGAGWGYVNDGNAYVAQHPGDAADKDATGLYALGSSATSKPIVYELPLDAGTYTVTAGFREWWSGPRQMKVSLVTASGATTVITPNVTVSSSLTRNAMVSGHVTVAAGDGGLAQLRVDIAGGTEAPVLGWFGVASGAWDIDTAPISVGAPTASVAAGIYKTAQSVALSTATPGAAIYYTTDGTDASRANGTRYTGPVTVSSSRTLKAVAVSDGFPSAQFEAAYDIEPDPGTYSSVPVGRLWYDTAGTPIQGHGGNVLARDGWYYWVGENKTDNSTRFAGISLYKSRDLKNWTYVKDILTAGSAGELADCNVERPKLVYNAKTGTFVLWAHWERATDYSASHLMVATSSTVDGDYRFLKDFRPGAGQVATADADPTYTGGDGKWGYGSRDFTVFQDPATSDAYLVSTQNGTDMRVYKLTDDYTDVDWQHSYPLFAGSRREAPALVKVGDYYVVLTSSQSGWYPNQAMYSFTKDISDPAGWSPLKPVGNNTTFYSQPTNILPLTGKNGTTRYIYMGDRWTPKALGTSTYVWLPLDVTAATGAGGPDISMGYQPQWSFDTASGDLTLSTDRLVSQDKPVVATAAAAGHPAGDANDGNVFNLNVSGDNSNFYQPSSVPYSWTVDLQRPYDLSRVDLSFRSYNGSETYSGYTVEGSDDGQAWTRLVGQSAGRTVGFTSNTLTGTYRYVRVSVSKVVNDHNGNGADWAAGLVEVQVYAHPDAQDVTFAALPEQVLHAADIPLHATASSGLPVRFTAQGACDLDGSALRLARAGTCTVTAAQDGNADFRPAADVTRTFAIAYKAVTLTDLSRPVRGGATLPLRVKLTDAAGSDQASPLVRVRALGIDTRAETADGHTSFGEDFTPTGGAYLHLLDTKGLAAGTHTFAFSAGSDPTVHTVTFTVA